MMTEQEERDALALRDAPRRRLSLVAGNQASIALAQLIHFAAEGDLGTHTPFDEEVVELLLDAAKMAMEVEARSIEPDEDRVEIKRAVDRYLDGWR
jgi:hypothetical protein